MKKKIIYLLLMLLPVFSFAQEITGVWKGELYVDSTKKYWPFQLTISEYKGKYTGYSRISFEEDGVTQVVYRDHTIKLKDNILIIEDDDQLAKASSVAQSKEVKKVMVVSLNTVDSNQVLSGTWSTNKTRHYLAATGSVKMQKKKDFKSTEIFKKLDSLSLTQKLSFNKPPVAVVEPPKEEPELKLDKIILSGIAKVDMPKKVIAPSTKITKPDPSIKPKEQPIAKIEKPIVPEVKPAVVTTTPVIKKPEPPIVKTPPVIKQKEPVVKNDKPAITKAAPPVVVAKPVQQEKPVEKKINILPEQKNAAIDVASRSNNSMQSLYYKTDSLQLTLYDNGEIDGDTVSVLLNGKVIIAKKRLDIKPNNYTIYFDKNTPDSQMLVMYAENLGSIPPNTGLLVVHDGAAVYEVRFSADLKTNATIILRRRKNE